MGILISVITITLLVLCYVRMYNRLKRLSVKVQEGSAGIDVALEKRYDMLSEEIEAVKSIWHMSIRSTQKSHLPARERTERKHISGKETTV